MLNDNEFSANKGDGDTNLNVANEIDDQQFDEEDVNILCLLSLNGQLGAAYYNFIQKLLFVYDDMADTGPNFLKSQLIYRDVRPKFTVLLGKINDDFIEILTTSYQSLRHEESVMANIEIGNRMLPSNFHVLSLKDYSFESAKTTLSQLTLASCNFNNDETARDMYVHSLINFDHKMSVHATGALVRYLDKNWAFFGSNKEDLEFLHIQEKSITNHVLMDSTTFNALQIFQAKAHESNFIRGVRSACREGLSVFRVFSNHCKTTLGLRKLREILRNPINDIVELQKRLEFINFVINPYNAEYVDSLQQNIKEISDVKAMLLKVKHFRASGRDWQILHKTIYHTILISRMSEPFIKKSSIFGDLRQVLADDILILEHTIKTNIDFDPKLRLASRPVIKQGVNPDLDAKRLILKDMESFVTAASQTVLAKLPYFIEECSINYVPEVGHILAIKEWEPNCVPERLAEFGCTYVFSLHGILHYKTAVCTELDDMVGSTNAEIIAHENVILDQLTNSLINNHKNLFRAVELVAYIDSLLAMAKVATQNNYVRPNLNENSVHEIIACRHPLIELTSNFESNDFYSGHSHSHIKVITGPNGSGKSVFLKQMALNIYLAHIGSFIPAKKANISMVHSIHTRLKSAESASIRLSSFMLDISQVSHALHNTKETSLIILDEFGRGTSGNEGVALLCGVLQKFHSQGNMCPHILVSTHFQDVAKRLPKDSLIEHLKMGYTIQNEHILFLYKIQEGISNSFTLDIAAELQLSTDIIKRAKEIYKWFKKGKSLRALELSNSFEMCFTNINDLKIPPVDD